MSIKMHDNAIIYSNTDSDNTSEMDGSIISRIDNKSAGSERLIRTLYRDLDLISRISDNFSNTDPIQVGEFFITSIASRLNIAKAALFILESSQEDDDSQYMDQDIIGRGHNQEANEYIASILNNERDYLRLDQYVFSCVYHIGCGESANDLQFTMNKGIFWINLKAGRPFNTTTNNNAPDRLYAGELEKYGLAQLNLSYWVPLMNPERREVVGFVGLERFFPRNIDYDFLLHLSTKTAKALCTIILYRKLEKSRQNLTDQIHKLRTLYDVGRVLSAIDNRNNLLTQILSYAAKAANAAKGSIMLFDSASEYLETRVAYGVPEDIANKILNGTIITKKIKRGCGIAGQVAQSKVPAIVNDTNSNADFEHSKNEVSYTKSILCVPLLVHDDVIGVMNITNKNDGAVFDSKDLSIIMQVADQAAVAIYNAQLYELAVTDSLTKLFIRRHFFQKFSEEIRRSRRTKKSLGLIMLDIDHFKSVNDIYGHQCGDYVLCEVASIIKNTVRELDLVGRYGGEEFVVLLVDSDTAGAKTAAHRIHKALETAEIVWRDGGKAKELRISVSIGISAYPAHSEEQSTLIQYSDIAMYYSKRTGRNKTTIFSPEVREYVENELSRKAAKEEAANR